MRLVAVWLVLSVLAVSGFAQEPAPDSADTVYVPLDSLDAGIDLALKALKMRRGDLTFRGDYLEPDEYRMTEIDPFMKVPLDLINMANKKITKGFNYFTNIDSDYFSSDYKSTNPIVNILLKHGEKFLKLNEDNRLLFDENVRAKTGFGVINLFMVIINYADEMKIDNGIENQDIIQGKRDSLIEGFTLILEEDEEDEFRSVEEIDSLSQLEEEWAKALVTLASDQKMQSKDLDDYIENIWIWNLRSDYPDIPLSARNFSWKTSHGQIIIGDTIDNHYQGDLFIVIDPGGNDTYDIEFEGTGHHTYIIDYDGDDTYNMPENRVSPYFFGSNMIIDYDGDDLYNAGSWTLGAGLFGVGVLWDMKGNDRYYGDTFTMGAGCFGVGILRDDDGNDSYHAALFSQGFGFVDGVGVLIDNAGNDNYFAGGKYKDFIRYDDHYLSLSQGFGYGLRPKMSGGIGMLIDKSGNDVYISDIFGQGASYWYSLGMLADGGGNDQYISFQYAQGNGTHMSLGILYDVEGDDVYSAKGVSQGCGHDRAAGFLIDLDGDDNYNAYDLCQGAGSANGLGLIADVRGKDVYIVRSDRNTQGYGNPRREYGSIGIFLDLAGEDNYSGGLGRDNLWWTYSMWGVGIDK